VARLSRPRWAALLLAAPMVFGPVAVRAQVEVVFVGNEGVLLSDGAVTLASDLPYRPGALGYARYRLASLPSGPRVVALVSHRHADHFSPELWLDLGWRIIGPAEVTAGLPRDRVIPLDSTVTLGPITVTPFPTTHGGTEHYSYLVEWSGLRFYFAGDTEDASRLLAQRDLDIAFVTPWLYRSTQDLGPIDSRRTVIYHHRSPGDAPPCDCTVPSEGVAIPVP